MKIKLNLCGNYENENPRRTYPEKWYSLFVPIGADEWRTLKMGGYKIIPGHTDYAISKGGKVIRRKDKKMMKPTLSNGYLTVSINGKSTLVHRLVAATYCTNEPLAGKPVHHINGDKLDNRASNLAVCETRQQHDYEHFIIREYFMREVAHTKKFRAYRDMMLNKFEIE